MPKKRVKVEASHDRDTLLGRASPLGKPVCVGNHSFIIIFFFSPCCAVVGLLPNHSHADGELGTAFHIS